MNKRRMNDLLLFLQHKHALIRLSFHLFFCCAVRKHPRVVVDPVIVYWS